MTRVVRWAAARRSDDPPTLFSWNVEARTDGGACGVTDDPHAAMGHLKDALAQAPCGAYGHVRRVLPPSSGQGTYLELGTVAQARQTETGVSWVSMSATDPLDP